MAITPSIAQILQCVAKVETTYGTDAAPTGGTDDALLIDSPTPFTPNISFIRARDHGTEFTRRKGTPAKRKYDVRVQFRTQGSGAAGATANGFSGQDALVQAAGITSTKNAGTSIVWTPAARASLKSATVWTSEDGVRRKSQGVYGTLTMSGAPDGFVLSTFEGNGLYNAVEDGANGTISGYTGGTARAEAFLNAAGTINNGSSMTSWVFDSFTFRTGSTNGDVDDANSSTGLNRLIFTDRDPDVEIVVMLDTDSSATIPFKTFEANLLAQTTHALTFSWGTTPNKCTVSIPTAQLAGLRPDVKNGYRIARVQYVAQHATNNSEFSFTWT